MTRTRLRRGLLLPTLALAALLAPASASAQSAPDVGTFGIQSLDSTSVEVLGRINPFRSETQYRVQYDVDGSEWCQTSGAAGTPANQTTSENLTEPSNTYHVVSVELSELTSGTGYCARLTATNEHGPGHGGIVRFTAGAPAVQTLVGISTGAVTASVSGSVNPVGRPTQYWARYGPMTSTWCQSGGAGGSALDVTTPQVLPQTDNASHGVTVNLGGLDPETEYCAQLVASNAAGTGSGDHVTFATDVAPIQLCSATWNGGDGNWTDDNWTFEAPSTDANEDGYPDADDKACIPDGTVSLPGSEAVAGLRVTGTGGLDVSGALTLDDPETITANDGDATVSSGGTVQLTSTAAVSSSLVGGTLTNAGSVRTLAGAGGARTLSFAAIVNGGSATLESNTATNIAAFSFTNSGTITVNGGLATNQHTALSTGGHELNQNAGTIGGTGTFLLQNGAYHHNGGETSSTVLSATGESLDLDGSGTATVSAISGTSFLAGDVAAGKTINVVGGIFSQPATLSLTASRANAGTIVLTNAAADDNGAATLDLGANDLTSTGTVRSRAVGSGAGSRTVDGTGTLANAQGGTLSLTHATTIASHLTNAGFAEVWEVQVTMSNFDFVQTGGLTATEGQLDLTAGKFDLQGGILAASGQLGGPLENSGGTVSPGSGAAGQFTVTGDYTQGENGRLRVDVDGTAPGSGHDQLVVGGTATLGGAVDVDGGALTPSVADEFAFVTSAGALSGTFATETGMTASGGFGYHTAYEAGPPGVAKLTVVKQYTLSVARNGSGSGTVTSAPAGIDCGEDCTHDFDEGTAVTLSAAPADGSRFAGWSGAGSEACSGTTCAVTLSEARSVTATFVQQRALAVTKTGSGAGTVTSNTGGVDCGSDCTRDYDEGAVVTLTASPAPGSRFAGWSGEGCSGTATCEVTMSAARAVTATFVQRHALAAVKTGTGSGTVTGTGIDCGTDCDETLDQGTTVTLTAVPSAGSRFAGWSGEGCSGTATCEVTMGVARTVTANFARQRTLTVARTGTGAGTVNGTGIVCGADCEETYDQGTVVTLTAAPSGSSRFGGWTGAGTEGCTGTTCQVTMSQARNVSAAFVARLPLTVTKAGAGVVTGTGIDCGSDCNETYDHGTAVTLTATPAAGMRFSGWSGDCSGTAPCELTTSQARSVIAIFVKADDDGDGVSPPADCNDSDARVKPGATDVPGNGVDEDCSGADVPGAPAPPPPPPPPPAPADSDGDGVPDATDPEPADPSIPGPFGSTNSNDTLDATGVDERICGLLGNDVIRALGGNDTVFGDLCDVKAKLTAAQAGAGGDDTLDGGAGNDTLYGAGGADRLLGADGADRLFGGGGNDTLDGGKGRDALDGGSGNDKLTGGADVNTYKGGAGDDTVNAKNGKRETVDCGAGKKDSASVDKADKVKGCEKVKRARK